MKTATTSTPASNHWFARLRQVATKAWELHVRHCELMAQARRRF